MRFDVAIIGGGISGLVTAYDLHSRGRKVVVLERQQRIGGNAVSERIDGFLMEHGPTTLNAMAPDALQLSGELGLCEEQTSLGSGVRKRYLRQGDDLHGVSIHPAGFLFSSYLSLAGRASLVLEALRRRKSGSEDETVHAFASRRFGAEFAAKVMDPLVAGMFGGDAAKLSMSAVFPRLCEMEEKYGSITRGIMRARRGSEPSKRLFSFRGGVGVLPQSLAARLNGHVRTAMAVTSITRQKNGYAISIYNQATVLARCVVLAVQPHVAAQLLARLDEQAAQITAAIDAPPMSVVLLGYRRDQVGHRLDGLGFLSTADSGGIITGAQFPSTMFAHRAPGGFVSVCAYVGGARNRDAGLMNADELTGEVHSELSRLLQIRREPVMSRCRQWVRSLPQYEPGHVERAAILQTLHERCPGLFLAGNYLSGVSVGNCIAQARRTAGQVEALLQAGGGQEKAVKVSAG